MRTAQLSQLMAAPLASLFLILSLCAFRLPHQRSVGERLIVTKVVSGCGDSDPVFFHLSENQTARVNLQQMPLGEAYASVKNALSPRAERAVFFSSAGDASMEEVATAIAKLREDSPDLFLQSVTSKEFQQLTNRLNPPVGASMDEDRCFVAVNPRLYFD